ncbi:acyltransferase family protein [Undibacterium sp. TS12]|uniref:acyltransferase family protein n=1 Tax=Undibacterium sp. TS12 TaxID=2908202 RepID=UPI001F4C75AE|nr:acyltransferase family protein [Undibacterium sp. TS12]MCH8619112.1 acyltransferase family protein [Undibacterium sp. TS12]
MSTLTSPNFRNQSIDNIKGVLIFLVVFGHLIEIYVGDDHVLRSVWIFVYSFHMPMFALMSGMFSKASLDDKNVKQLIATVVVPLLGFEIIYETTEFLLKGNASVYANLIAPYWMLWYLLSLLCWRLLLPLFARMQFGVVFALALSLIGNYSEHAGYFLGISRTLVFFPYFLLGWKLGQSSLTIKKNERLIASTLIVIAAFVGSFLLKSDFDYRWFYGSYSLHRLEMANLTGSMYQLLQYAASTVIGLSILYLLAQKDLKLASIGRRSLYVLLWHGMALIILQETGVLRAIFKHDNTVALLISILVSMAITWVCAHEKTEWLTKRIILNPLAWLLIPQTPQAPIPTNAVAENKAIQPEP